MTVEVGVEGAGGLDTPRDMEGAGGLDASREGVDVVACGETRDAEQADMACGSSSAARACRGGTERIVLYWISFGASSVGLEGCRSVEPFRVGSGGRVGLYVGGFTFCCDWGKSFEEGEEGCSNIEYLGVVRGASPLEGFLTCTIVGNGNACRVAIASVGVVGNNRSRFIGSRFALTRSFVAFKAGMVRTLRDITPCSLPDAIS